MVYNMPLPIALSMVSKSVVAESSSQKIEAVHEHFIVIQNFGGVRNSLNINPYPTAFPYGNGMVLHFYQQQESSTTKTVHKVINKGLKTYV